VRVLGGKHDLLGGSFEGNCRVSTTCKVDIKKRDTRFRQKNSGKKGQRIRGRETKSWRYDSITIVKKKDGKEEKAPLHRGEKDRGYRGRTITANSQGKLRSEFREKKE